MVAWNYHEDYTSRATRTLFCVSDWMCFDQCIWRIPGYQKQSKKRRERMKKVSWKSCQKDLCTRRKIQSKMNILYCVYAFFKIRTSNFRLSWLFLNFWRFQPRVVLKLFLFPDIFKPWISCPEHYMYNGTKKYKFETVNTAFENVTSLVITLPAPDGDDQANIWQVLLSCTSQSVYKD